jgi:hypothetical protein
MIKKTLDEDGIKWEDNCIGLLRNEKNIKLLIYYERHLARFFENEKYCQKVLTFLENSKYALNLEDTEGNILSFIKIKENYYIGRSALYVCNRKLRKYLTFMIYEKADLSEGKRLAVKNLTSIVQGELSLGDRKIIRDVALETFYSNLEKLINKEYPEINSWAACTRTDLHDWPKNQLISYGFKIEHPWFYDVYLPKA